MTHSKTNPNRRARRESGASAVELALIAPLLVLLTFGLLEGALLLWNLTTAQTAVGAGTRTLGSLSRQVDYQISVAGVVRAGTSGSNALPEKLVIFKADPTTGRPTGLAASSSDFSQCTADCYVFVWNDTTKAWIPNASPSWPSTSQKACGPEASTDYAGLWLRSKYQSITGLGILTREFTASGVTRLEPVPTSTGLLCQP